MGRSSLSLFKTYMHDLSLGMLVSYKSGLGLTHQRVCYSLEYPKRLLAPPILPVFQICRQWLYATPTAFC
ncbi:hypothetical protein PIIN_10331 [Serendipita indica DSM 11827]|uniref:Uncharacterized protein n=1 Tax=Serendipita indica (strain DSM 11827) TaxID=1109443 RepID=G4TYE3_SERID|nr:hypothetical protein PIIN_10331 [Serendipita indica DSM 11827]